MDNISDTIQNLNPTVVVGSNIASSIVNWLGVINPILSFICMLISAVGGIYWILLKRREYNKG
ncbi:MAG: hypothetical protein Unbinned3849contig1000_55 [Prokaryotic dsDNA virus sp.]|nr:MAG: hypothetical protein Unbinned3849contig1000_55 [Prokaryotic dsDNA virus sp.]